MSNSSERKLFFYNFKVFKDNVDCKLYPIFNQYNTILNNDYTNLKGRGLIYNPSKDERMYLQKL